MKNHYLTPDIEVVVLTQEVLLISGGAENDPFGGKNNSWEPWL